MFKKLILGVIVVATICFLYKATINSRMNVRVQNYSDKVVDVENGNTLILNNGLRVYLLGVEPGHKSTEMWLRNNIVGERVWLVADSRNEQEFRSTQSTIKAYALMREENSKVCINRRIIVDNPSAYSIAFMQDSSFLSSKQEVTDIHDKPLFMRQRALCVSVGKVVVGTAFFINNQGLAITNNHVLDSISGGCVYLYSNNPADSKMREKNKREIANVIWSNPQLDITIFAVKLQSGEKVPYFNLADQHEPIGRYCHIYGNPQGYLGTYSSGRITAYREDDEVSGRQLAQYELSTNAGNSGAPIMSNTGDVIAVHIKSVKKQINGEVAQGLNFGIDIMQVREILNELDLEYGGK